ncbi:MAG: AsmA-like C-terminal region-containing protein [Bacteroidia bacterium]
MKSTKFLFRWLVYLLIGLVLFLGGLSVYLYTQQDKIKASIVSVLNRQLQSPVSVNGPIYLSLFENFPSVSLSFPKVSVQAMAQGQVADYPLLSAERLSLSFSLLDIFRGRYQLQQLSITDAAIDLRFDENGDPNYQIWKTDSSSNAENASFAIQKLVLRRVRLNYVNASEHQLLSASLTDADFKGDFSQRKFNLRARASLESGSLQLDGRQFLRHQQLGLQLSMEVDLDAETVRFPDSELRLNRERLQLQGFHRWGEPAETELNFSAEKFRAAQVLAFYREESGFLNDLDVDGELSIKGRWHYVPGAPELSLQAILQDASLYYKPYQLRYKGNTLIEASYNRKQLLELSFNQLSLQQQGDRLTGHLRYFEKSGLLEGSVVGNIQLEHYQELLALWELEAVKGTAGLNHRFRIYPGTEKPVMLSGHLQLQQVSARYLQHQISGLRGLAQIEDGQKLLKLQIGAMQLDSVQLNAELQVLNYPALYDKKAGDFDLRGELFADKWHWQSSGSNSGSPALLPSRIDLRLVLGKLYWYNYQFDALDVRFSGKPNDLRIRLDNWQLADGRLSGLLNWKAQASGYQLQGSMSGKQLDISKLFNSFHDFDQDFLTGEHLSGKLDVKMSLLLPFNSEYDLQSQHMELIADLDVQQGGLRNFEPMNGLSRFVDAKELQDLRFQRLTNHIEISNGVIDIPEMDINSNAARLAISGKHTLDNAYTYYIQVSLSDLWKKRQKQISFDAALAEDRPGGGVKLFLVLEGKGSDFKIRYNKIEVRDQLKQSAAAARTDIKRLVKEELDGTARQKQYENQRLDDIVPISIEADTLEKVPEKEFDPVYLRKPKARRGG